MESNGRWLNWAALIVGGLALIFALGGRGDQGRVEVRVGNGPVVAPPQAPQPPQAPAAPGDPRGYSPRDNYGPQGGYSPREGNDPRAGYGQMGGFRHHGGPFGFLGGIVKFFGFLLLIGLVMRFVAGRRGWGGPPWRRGWGGPGGHHGGCQGNAPKGEQQPERKEGDSDEPTPPATGQTVRL